MPKRCLFFHFIANSIDVLSYFKNISTFAVEMNLLGPIVGANLVDVTL